MQLLESAIEGTLPFYKQNLKRENVSLRRKKQKLKRVFFLFFGLIVLVGISCDNTPAQEQETATTVGSDSSDILGSASLQLPKIIGRGQAIVDDWSIFDDLQTELVALNSLPLPDVRSRIERLVLFGDSLAKTVPDTLGVQPVKSRLLVLNTRIRLLEQAVNSGRPKEEQIKECFLELNQSWGFLKIQINEKLQKDLIDTQRREDEKAELEKQRAKLDSIAAAEGLN